ncbi:TPA: cold-shock protein [Vibrio parahaemolyticus]
MLGSINTYNTSKGYGFIINDIGTKVFFHISDWKPQSIPKQGNNVIFEPGYDQRGRACAKEVDLAVSDNGMSPSMEAISEWDRDAKEEDTNRYFCSFGYEKGIIKGKKSFIIARKGCGKTALALHLDSMNVPGKLSKYLTFKQFPFNELLIHSDSSYLSSGRFVTVWKYIIYSNICQLMLLNDNISQRARDLLKSVYERDFQDTINNNVRKWTGKKFGVSVLTNGFQYEESAQIVNEPDALPDKTYVLEKFIIENIDSSDYLILFDELDDAYVNLSDSELNNYKNIICGLFKAVADIRYNLNKKCGKKVFPVIFLRDDIYNILQDPDKGKWRDLIIGLEWNQNLIKEMLAYRLSKAIDDGIEIYEFDKIWRATVNINPIVKSYGKAITIYQYMTERTFERPRDYVLFLKYSAELAERYNKITISQVEVQNVRNKISLSLREELEGELCGLVPEIKEVFDVFIALGKRIFDFSDFEKAFNEHFPSGLVGEMSCKDLLCLLFEHSVIGNHYSPNKNDFKYKNSKVKIKYNSKLIVFLGLNNELNLR